MLTGLFAEVVVLVVVVWVVVGVVVAAFFGEAAVVVCVVAVDVVCVAALWVLDVLWLADDVWAVRALCGLGLLVVAGLAGGMDAIGVDAIDVDAAAWCVVEFVVEALRPHAARLRVSAIMPRAAIRPRTLDGERRRGSGLLLATSGM